MEEEIVENPTLLCRICLNTGNYELSSLMTLENERVLLEDMLMEFSSIVVRFLNIAIHISLIVHSLREAEISRPCSVQIAFHNWVIATCS